MMTLDACNTYVQRDIAGAQHQIAISPCLTIPLVADIWVKTCLRAVLRPLCIVNVDVDVRTCRSWCKSSSLCKYGREGGYWKLHMAYHHC